MKIVEKPNGYVHITSEKGVVDTRNGLWSREAVVKKEDAKFFVEAE